MKNNLKWQKKDNIQILKNGNKIIGFTGWQNGEPYYAFGKPSQNYIQFICKTENQAKQNLLNNICSKQVGDSYL
jgi:ribonucleotide monophosphatase NagD (HAD superfamily)